MASAQRSSDIAEIHSERCLMFGIAGAGLLGLGWLLIYYQGMFLVLGYMLAGGGVACLGFSAWCFVSTRRVKSFGVECPYCKANNSLTEQPERDFKCDGCHRLVPIGAQGQVLSVAEVSCSHCAHTNYHSWRTDLIICENCEHEITIHRPAVQHSADSYHAYTTIDDDKLYNVVMTGTGKRSEEAIAFLQHMLGLNRNQVKDLLAELPVTLLAGINRKKADMLLAQLTMHDVEGHTTLA